jgi:hypothetical protein
MAETDVTIVNKALSLIGEDVITLLTDSNIRAETANLHYTAAVEAALGSWDWTFAKTELDLGVPDVTQPLNGQWSRSHTIDTPGDVLRIVTLVLGNDDEVPYIRVGNRIFTNLDDAAEPVLIHIEDPGEANYPAYFVRYLVYMLAEIFAGAITENDEVRARMEQRRDDYWNKAIMSDQGGQPPRKAKIGRRFINSRR